MFPDRSHAAAVVPGLNGPPWIKDPAGANNGAILPGSALSC